MMPAVIKRLALLGYVFVGFFIYVNILSRLKFVDYDILARLTVGKSYDYI